MKIMQFRKIFRGMLFIVAAFLWSCSGNTDTTEVVIISTNDIHAQINKFPQFATFVRKQRAVHPNLLVVDGGDRFSGNVYVDNAVERGKPMVVLMNAVGYDLATFGNHEFDYGQVELKKRIEEMNFPVICANIEAEGSGLGQPQGHHILEKAGIRFCFVSMIGIDGKNRIPATNPAHLENISFRHFSEVVEENKELKEVCDVFVALTHLGYTADSVLAVSMPELDVIEADYADAMVERENLVSTYMGMGVAIPHGTSQKKETVKKSGVVLLQYPDGVDFGEEKAYLVFGIAGVGDEHLELLGNVCNVLEDEDALEKMKTSSDIDFLMGQLS